MKNKIFIKFLFIVFIITIISLNGIVSAATLKFKDTVCRFHDKSWSADNNILTTIMYMDKDVCYCLDYARAVSKNSSSYKVQSRTVSSKLQYVVMNGYPSKDLGLGSDDVNYAATQLAVWYFSDSTNGVPFYLENLVANSGYQSYASSSISGAKKLIAAANKYGNSYTIPTPSLTVDSSSATSKVDGSTIKIGPYRAVIKNSSTNSANVALSGAPSGAKIVDKSGNSKSSFSNSEDIYVIVPSSTSGSAKLKFSLNSTNYVAKIYSTNEGPYTVSYNGKNVYYQDQLVMIPQTAELSKNVNLSWENAKGNLTVTKKGSDGVLLAGVKFALYDSKNNLISTKQTNQEGIISFSNLDPGNYYLLEKSTATGYIKSSEKINVKITAGKPTETTVINKKIQSAIKITKVDDVDGSPIKGAVFEILNSKGKVVSTITTDKNGVATSDDLEYGTYYYREKSVPTAYIIDKTKYEFSITGSNIVEKKVVNKVKEGSITIKKLDGEKKEVPLKGAKFEVYDADGNLIEKLTTNKNGEASIKNLKLGAYTIKEVEAPKGYKLDSKVYDLTITPANIDIVKTIYNFKEEVKKGSLKIIKIDGQTSEPIAGVKFELYDSNNNLLDTMITDNEGIIYVENLPVGNYYYREIEAPGDYIVDDTLKIFSISEENLEFVITIKNDKEEIEMFGSLEVLKVGESDEPLQGVKFELYSESGEMVGTLITGYDGKANCSNLKIGKYTLKEVETLEGYRMSTEYIDFEITEASLEASVKVVNMRDRLIQTGDFFSTNMLIVINVTVICTVVFFILKKRVLV